MGNFSPPCLCLFSREVIPFPVILNKITSSSPDVDGAPFPLSDTTLSQSPTFPFLILFLLLPFSSRLLFLEEADLTLANHSVWQPELLSDPSSSAFRLTTSPSREISHQGSFFPHPALFLPDASFRYQLYPSTPLRAEPLFPDRCQGALPFPTAVTPGFRYYVSTLPDPLSRNGPLFSGCRPEAVIRVFSSLKSPSPSVRPFPYQTAEKCSSLPSPPRGRFHLYSSPGVRDLSPLLQREKVSQLAIGGSSTSRRLPLLQSSFFLCFRVLNEALVAKSQTARDVS